MWEVGGKTLYYKGLFLDDSLGKLLKGQCDKVETDPGFYWSNEEILKEFSSRSG